MFIERQAQPPRRRGPFEGVGHQVDQIPCRFIPVLQTAHGPLCNPVHKHLTPHGVKTEKTGPLPEKSRAQWAKEFYEVVQAFNCLVDLSAARHSGPGYPGRSRIARIEPKTRSRPKLSSTKSHARRPPAPRGARLRGESRCQTRRATTCSRRRLHAERRARPETLGSTGRPWRRSTARSNSPPDNYDALKLRAKLLLTFHPLRGGTQVRAACRGAQPARPRQLRRDDRRSRRAWRVPRGPPRGRSSGWLTSVPTRPPTRRVSYLRWLHGDVAGAVEAMRIAAQVARPCKTREGRLVHTSSSWADALLCTRSTAGQRPSASFTVPFLSSPATAPRSTAKARARAAAGDSSKAQAPKSTAREHEARAVGRHGPRPRRPLRQAR